MTTTEGYMEKNINFPSGGIQLEGTLTLPQNTTRPPIVLLLPGSGPTDRNENVIKGSRKFLPDTLKIIAAHLAHHGYASYRYDKRGVGKTQHLAAQVGFTDIVNDATNAVAFLSTLKETDPGHIFILGHSEGGMVGTILSAEEKTIRGLIGIASPIVSLDGLVIRQISHILTMRGRKKENVDATAHAFKETFDLMRKQKDWETIDAHQIKQIFSKVSFAFRLLPAKNAKKALAKQFRPKWFIQSFEYNFEDIAKKITCPVLLVFGEKDYQVPVDEGKKFEHVLKQQNTEVTLVVVPNMNHMLRQNPGPMDPKNSLRSLKTPFDQQVLDTIIEWLAKKTGKQ
jgi:pimeloyl-ACP methyl ester carboxylesterase